MNLRIYITAEFEDGGTEKKWEEAVSGELINSDSVVNQAVEALGRIGRQIETFAGLIPVDEDEEEEPGFDRAIDDGDLDEGKEEVVASAKNGDKSMFRAISAGARIEATPWDAARNPWADAIDPFSPREKSPTQSEAYRLAH